MHLLTIQIIKASQFADRHLSEILIDPSLEPGNYAGRYKRTDGNSAYNWRLNVEPLELTSLQEDLVAFSDKVKPLKVSLRIGIEAFGRELDFHMLVLSPPLQLSQTEKNEMGSVR